MENNILILGHRGMLGRSVYSYFTKTLKEFNVTVIPEGIRWPSEEFKNILGTSDWIVNCIGLIPQKNPLVSDIFLVNTDLPLYLWSTGKKIIHASTDCEYSGKIDQSSKYLIDDFEDTYDNYGISKAIVTRFVKNSSSDNFNIIRSSIIGIEEYTNYSLLNWAKTQFEKNHNVNGFSNHIWNGITCLKWAEIASEIILGKVGGNKIIQPGIDPLSKYDLLCKIKETFCPNSKSHILKIEKDNPQNKSLDVNYHAENISEMLKKMKDFYNL